MKAQNKSRAPPKSAEWMCAWKPFPFKVKAAHCNLIRVIFLFGVLLFEDPPPTLKPVYLKLLRVPAHLIHIVLVSQSHCPDVFLIFVFVSCSRGRWSHVGHGCSRALLRSPKGALENLRVCRLCSEVTQRCTN